MYTIAVVNEKGGTGKTTTSVSLAAALGKLGQRILLVDLDGQASTSRWFGVEEDDRLADALLAGEGLEPIENIAPGVSLAPSTGKVDSVARDLRPSQSAQLRKVLRQIQDRYDLIIMDCPPSLNNRLIGNALLAATHVLVPVETSIMALDGLQILLTTLEDISDAFEHQIVLAGVVACRYDSRTRLSRLVLDELRRALPNKVFNTVIRENVRMRECPASGQSILEFAPDSHAAEDYLALAKEMLANPDAWQKPAYWEIKDAHEIDDETQRCSVDNLRSRAAATVRAAVAKTGPTKPLEPGEAADAADAPQASEAAEASQATDVPQAAEAAQAPEVPPPAEQPQTPQAGTAEAAFNNWTDASVPDPTEGTLQPPAGIPAVSITAEDGPGPLLEQAEPVQAEPVQAEPAHAGPTNAAFNRWSGGPVPNRIHETLESEPSDGIPAVSITDENDPGPLVEQAESDQAGPSDAEFNRWAGGPVPNRIHETHESEPPAETPADSLTLDFRTDTPPSQPHRDSYIDRLARAKARLSAPELQLEANEPPAQPAPVVAAQSAEPEPIAAAPQADVEAIRTPTPPPTPPPAMQEEPAKPQESEKPEEPKAGGKAFPALRAMLRQMGHGQEMAEAGSGKGTNATNGR